MLLIIVARYRIDAQARQVGVYNDFALARSRVAVALVTVADTVRSPLPSAVRTDSGTFTDRSDRSALSRCTCCRQWSRWQCCPPPRSLPCR